MLTYTFDVSLSWLILEVVSIVDKYPCNLGPINLAFRIWGPGSGPQCHGASQVQCQELKDNQGTFKMSEKGGKAEEKKDRRVEFLQDFTLKSMRLKIDKWNKIVVHDEQRQYLQVDDDDCLILFLVHTTVFFIETLCTCMKNTTRSHCKFALLCPGLP